MARSKSSKKWLTEHFSDPYVKQSHVAGYRSRAAYKLLELQERDKLFRPGLKIVDLGAAPGGWSQVARQFIGKNDKIIALDILPMDNLAQVDFIQGDFQTEETYNQLLMKLGNERVDLVMSDIAPNITGVKSVDQPKSIYLVDLAIDLAQQVLKSEGTLLVKIFQGEGFDAVLATLRKNFKKVLTRKPKASRARSPEVYLLAQGYRALH